MRRSPLEKAEAAAAILRAAVCAGRGAQRRRLRRQRRGRRRNYARASARVRNLQHELATYGLGEFFETLGRNREGARAADDAVDVVVLELSVIHAPVALAVVTGADHGQPVDGDSLGHDLVAHAVDRRSGVVRPVAGNIDALLRAFDRVRLDHLCSELHGLADRGALTEIEWRAQ